MEQCRLCTCRSRKAAWPQLLKRQPRCMVPPENFLRGSGKKEGEENCLKTILSMEVQGLELSQGQELCYFSLRVSCIMVTSSIDSLIISRLYSRVSTVPAKADVRLVKQI